MEPHGVPLRLALAIPVHAEPRHRDLKTLDQFDWDFNASLPRKQLFELATCKFLDDARDVLLMQGNRILYGPHLRSARPRPAFPSCALCLPMG